MDYLDSRIPTPNPRGSFRRSASHATHTWQSPGKVALWAVAILILISMVGRASAQDGWLRNGKPINGQPNMAVAGDFAVMQIMTNDPDHLVAEWQKPTPRVALTGTTRTYLNQRITTFLVFKGCRPDSSGKCNITADYDVFDSMGKLSAQTKLTEIWVGHPPTPGNNLQLSEAGFGISFDDTDALGAYRIRATVTDHVAAVTLHTEQVLTLLSK